VFNPRQQDVIASLHAGLAAALEQQQLDPAFLGVARAFQGLDVPVDRLHAPLSRLSGLRHPEYGAILFRWERREGVDVELVPHGDVSQLTDLKALAEAMREMGSPYHVLVEGRDRIRHRLAEIEPELSVLQVFKADGFTDYLAFVLPMPTGDRQLMSIATRAPGGFEPDIEDVVTAMRPLIAMVISGVLLSSVARSVARVYVGSRAGNRVLAGEIVRGHQTEIDAGVMFCDMRGFTALSERLGTAEIISVMNAIFERVGTAVAPRGGEILKFIGDAMLIIFPREGDDAPVARAMVEAAREALDAVDLYAEESALPVALGFGLHIGDVHYGNIGTRKRLDFTVMGPTVNLASRLESQCKNLGAKLVASARVAQSTGGLVDLGQVRLKGVSAPVGVFGMPA